jgi:hypothetical protein
VTSDGCRGHALTCASLSRWLSSCLADSRAHVPSMCPYGFRGLFVLKPSNGAVCQDRSMPGLGSAVRRCLLASTVVGGDSHLVTRSLPRLCRLPGGGGRVKLAHAGIYLLLMQHQRSGGGMWHDLIRRPARLPRPAFRPVECATSSCHIGT